MPMLFLHAGQPPPQGDSTARILRSITPLGEWLYFLQCETHGQQDQWLFPISHHLRFYSFLASIG